MPTSISIIYTLSLHDALPILLGNPYSSKDAGMGPLMRDIKNKICQECELVSLLEDDSGLELLVNNKIISLDLPVKERSEEHTSELQSRFDLVCRLLLEKKKRQ